MVSLLWEFYILDSYPLETLENYKTNKVKEMKNWHINMEHFKGVQKY